ncbi:uncharacterized protein [Rutidosis leptorrhynchoides]|uniref:uncharacterized protein n=1 Tax=Rutidosis leptorrhynchoides TaxID=125765 RepID=UPI003A9A4245
MSSVSDFSTDQVFNNREELIEWVKKEARSHSQVIVIRRSKTKNGYLAKILFMCERGGMSVSKSAPEKSKPSKKIDCHAYAMRLTNEEECLVKDMSSNYVKPSEILATLKQRNPENVSSNMTIYNAKAKFRAISQSNQTPIQVVMSFLKEQSGSTIFTSQ